MHRFHLQVQHDQYLTLNIIDNHGQFYYFTDFIN